MKRIVLYSGGLNSFMTAWLIYLNYMPRDIRLVFTDTKTEDEDLYRFIKETSEYMGLELTILKDGRDIWQVFNDVKFMGNNRIDPCSKILKREIFRKWLIKNYATDECVLYYGIDFTESHRLKRIIQAWEPYIVKAPLCIPPLYDKTEIISLCKRINIKIPRLYDMGFQHNNCGGFCVKTGQAQFKLLLEKNRGRYLYHENEQEKLFEHIGKKNPFIRKSVNGKLYYLSLREFREYLESGKDFTDEENYQLKFDFGGCGCFS